MIPTVALSRCIARTVLVAVVLALPCAAGAQPSDDKVQLCNACHGENGIPQDKTIPVIWGQQQGYLYLQLRDYKRGDRKNEPMQAVVAEMERNDMMALAEYYSQKPWPQLRQPSASEPVAARALRANVALGCTGCHLGEYQGAGTQPRLAGQIKEYMAQTMLAFRTGERGNNPGMSDLMKAISEEDIAAAAEYLAGL
jgi:cytochrome c553